MLDSGLKNAEISDEDWGSEPDDGNQKLSSGISKLVVDSDLDKPENVRLDMLFEFFEKAKASDTIMVKNWINKRWIDFYFLEH